MQTELVRCLSCLLAAAALSSTAAMSADQPLVFISSFMPGKDGSIETFRLDSKTGRLSAVRRTAGVENPYFLAVSPNQRFLYSIHAKEFGGKEHEQVAAYAIDGQTGQLTLLNRQSTRGSASCNLHVEATGKTLLVANYSTGNVASMPVLDDGSLGPVVSL